VTNQHSSPTTGDFLYDIRFCPPKGAKPAAKNRPDTLYQNINANMAFKFNLHYKSKVWKKVMLACNLHINKGDGKFSKSVSSQTFTACPLIPLLTMCQRVLWKLNLCGVQYACNQICCHIINMLCNTHMWLGLCRGGCR